MLSKLRDPSEKTLAVLLLAPAFLLLLMIVVYPIGKLVYNSLYAVDKNGAFLGLQNYIDVVQDPLFWNATKNTLLITLITVPGALIAGLALAMLANLPFKRKWPVRLSLLLPWALPLSFAGLIFAWFFHTEYGVVNDVMNRLG
ncbi:sugar ABC transporter permease, partial [Limnohabitans sp.]